MNRSGPIDLDATDALSAGQSVPGGPAGSARAGQRRRGNGPGQQR